MAVKILCLRYSMVCNTLLQADSSRALHGIAEKQELGGAFYVALQHDSQRQTSTLCCMNLTACFFEILVPD